MAKDFEITDELRFEITGKLIAPGAPFEVTTERIRGVEYKVFANAYKNLREIYATSLDRESYMAKKIIEWYGDRDWEFMVYQDESYTFGETYRTAANLAWRLKEEYGVGKGDRVVVAMRNYPEFCISFMAVTGMGAVVVPLNSWWTGPELEYGVRDSDPKLLIVDQERLDRLEPYLSDLNLPMVVARPTSDLPENVREFREVVGRTDKDDFPPENAKPDEDAFIMYTSGSTGKPKGVVTTHRAVANTVMTWEMTYSGVVHLFPDLADQMRGEHKASTLLAVPLFHVTGLNTVFLTSFYNKRKMVMMYKWDPDEALRLIDKEKITSFTGVPTMSWEMVNSPNFHKYDTTSLAMLAGGGAERPPEHVKILEKKLDRHISAAGYGLTETSSLGAVNVGSDYRKRPDSVGRPMPPLIDAKIVDPMGRDLPAGETGEICLKSSVNFRGYWNRPEETRAAFLDDGWFRTGDVGYMDEEKYIFIKDRAKDIVIRGGENIACREVEFAIYEHPSVFEASVFGVPDDRLGEQLAAVVMIKPEAALNEDELREHLAGKLAKFKIPAHIWLQNEPLPRLGTGKIFKRKLKEDKTAWLQS
ncbi:MAG: acyl--CoA ligase [Proteobacteria bacterium]|nr:acyl--CoA ligase [Pseudomonadota bacterium]